CYELLLVWAEAVAQPELGHKNPTKTQIEEALRLLNRAARLGLPVTGAYHLRRASCLEQLGNAEGARQERQLAARPRKNSALDYFLIGVSHQKQGQLQNAADHFVEALRLQPDHFWARYFLGVCHLQLL